ncbi:unnamed protein product [Dicrocoelium dendriticum]|nr:unnamed protein product [Dicrocoelium dendriticum]
MAERIRLRPCNPDVAGSSMRGGSGDLRSILSPRVTGNWFLGSETSVQRPADIFFDAQRTTLFEGHLHNPAIFVGLQPSVYTMCLEYLEYAKKYPSAMSIVRGHVFKLCHHALNEHPDFRHHICVAQSVDELRDGVKALEDACSSCSKNRDASIPHPHWICQPYERPKSHTESQPESKPVAASEQDHETASIDSSKLQLQQDRRNRRDAKRARKMCKLQAKQLADLLCSNCQSNRKGTHCPNSFCRTCCWKMDPERSSKCEVHQREKRRKMA